MHNAYEYMVTCIIWSHNQPGVWDAMDTCSGGVQTECCYHMLLINSCSVNVQDVVYQHLAYMRVQHENLMQELWQKTHYIVTYTMYIFWNCNDASCSLFSERVAVKILDKAKLDQKTRKMLAREIATMESIHHPNIIRWIYTPAIKVLPFILL